MGLGLFSEALEMEFQLEGEFGDGKSWPSCFKMQNTFGGLGVSLHRPRE